MTNPLLFLAGVATSQITKINPKRPLEHVPDTALAVMDGVVARVEQFNTNVVADLDYQNPATFIRHALRMATETVTSEVGLRDSTKRKVTKIEEAVPLSVLLTGMHWNAWLIPEKSLYLAMWHEHVERVARSTTAQASEWDIRNISINLGGKAYTVRRLVKVSGLSVGLTIFQYNNTFAITLAELELTPEELIAYDECGACRKGYRDPAPVTHVGNVSRDIVDRVKALLVPGASTPTEPMCDDAVYWIGNVEVSQYADSPSSAGDTLGGIQPRAYIVGIDDTDYIDFYDWIDPLNAWFDHGDGAGSILFAGHPGCGKTGMLQYIVRKRGLLALECDAQTAFNNVGLIFALVGRTRLFDCLIINDVDHLVASNIGKALSSLENWRRAFPVLATTNDINRINPALRRTGRFDNIINLDDVEVQGLEEKLVALAEVHGVDALAAPAILPVLADVFRTQKSTGVIEMCNRYRRYGAEYELPPGDVTFSLDNNLSTAFKTHDAPPERPETRGEIAMTHEGSMLTFKNSVEAMAYMRAKGDLAGAQRVYAIEAMRLALLQEEK